MSNDNLPSSEDLDAIAEEQRVAELTEDVATLNFINNNEVARIPSLCTCGTPRRPGDTFCTHCGQNFGDAFATKQEPIVDEDGTTHSGWRIRLIGEGWPDALIRVKDLTDEQLEAQIRGLQAKLKEAVQTADYARISIAAREFEYEYRKHSRYVAAVKRREKLTNQGAIRLNNKTHKAGSSGPKIPADIAALMSLGITYEQALVMKAALGKAKS
jgi:hypothetical protein